MSLPPRRVKMGCERGALFGSKTPMPCVGSYLAGESNGRAAGPLAAAYAVLVLAWAGLAYAQSPAAARDPPSCKAVRLSDIGWTDVTSTTAILSALLRELGYDP